jgi:hypothetical protein
MTSKMEKEQLTTKPGKDQACKSKEIAFTPARGSKGRGTVTPSNQRSSKREQQYSKKKQEKQKQTMDQYFGGGERVKPPSQGGTPTQTMLQRWLMTTKESTTGTDDTVGKQHNLKQYNKE